MSPFAFRFQKHNDNPHLKAWQKGEFNLGLVSKGFYFFFDYRKNGDGDEGGGGM